MTARSGQITVTTAGTAVAGPSAPTGRVFELASLPGNTGIVYVGNDGSDDVTVANGFPLVAGTTLRVEVRRSLDELYFDAATSGDKIAWVVASL